MKYQLIHIYWFIYLAAGSCSHIQVAFKLFIIQGSRINQAQISSVLKKKSAVKQTNKRTNEQTNKVELLHSERPVDGQSQSQ